jgi:predicted  nucleic acid-binding Zn-ribbon protein
MKIKCPKCAYVWNYRGRLLKACCPSCGNKVDTIKYRVVEK